jgi:beta-galactosidase
MEKILRHSIHSLLIAAIIQSCTVMNLTPSLPTDVASEPDPRPLEPTLEFRQARLLNGREGYLAWQSGLPVPSFDPQDRPQVNLAGRWKKQRVDVDANLSLSSRKGTGVERLEAEAEGRYRPEYDDSGWQDKDLPMVENHLPTLPGDPQGAEVYEGGVWYRRHFFVPEEWSDQLITLNCLGANYVIDVWVNGNWVGYHEGGYTPFSLNVSSYVRPGQENLIALRIDNPAWGTRLDTVPAIKSDWMNYTGLIHDIYLQANPRVWIVRADVTVQENTGKISVRAVLHNSSDTAQAGELTVEVFDTDPTAEGWLRDPRASAIRKDPVGSSYHTPVALGAGEAVVAEMELFIPEVTFWNLGDPNLYILQADLESDSGTDRAAYQFGVRTIRTDSHRLLLNEEQIFLAGVARHEDWADSGRTAVWQKILLDLQLICSLGANFLRTAHYPNHVYTYLLTDRLGLAAWVEIPIWQYTAVEFDFQEKRQFADQMWREMILAGSNRPSIFFWSTNNESAVSLGRLSFIQRLVTDYRQNYPDGRLVTQSAAADRGGPADPSQDLLDVPGWTMYFGIFHGSTYYEGTADFLRKAHAAYPHRPLLNTEYGIWSSGGGSSPQRQVEVFRQTFQALSEVTSRDSTGSINPDGYLAGIVWWAAFDWYTAHTRVQTMGLYSMDRLQAKPVMEELRQAYQHWSLNSCKEK